MSSNAAASLGGLDQDTKHLIEVFPNRFPGKAYSHTMVCEEFTSVCPKTGHPDYAKVIVEYVPGAVCIELKAFKIYLQSFRNVGIFYENLVNVLFEALTAVADPVSIRVRIETSSRGGIHSILQRSSE